MFGIKNPSFFCIFSAKIVIFFKTLPNCVFQAHLSEPASCGGFRPPALFIASANVWPGLSNKTALNDSF